MPSPSAASSTKVASERSTHEVATAPHANRASRRGVALSRIQPATLNRLTKRDAGQARQGRTTAAAATPATTMIARPGLEPAADVRDAERDRRERRHRRAVDQAEQEERERDRAEARRARRQRRTTATRITSSQRPGSAIPPTDAAPPAAASVSTAGRCSAPEEVLPAPRLRGVGGEEDHGGQRDQPEVGAVQRPARVREMPRDERGHRESDQHETDVEEALQRQEVQSLSAARPPTCTLTL